LVGLDLTALLTQTRSYRAFTVIDYFEEKTYFNQGQVLNMISEN